MINSIFYIIDLIRNLRNVATPALQFDRNTSEIINKDNREKVERYGMPLSIFGKVTYTIYYIIYLSIYPLCRYIYSLIIYIHIYIIGMFLPTIYSTPTN